MTFDIIWSDEAENSFNGVIDYLLYHWSQKEAHHFISRTDELINLIGNQPLLFKPYKNKTNIRHGNLHKNVTMFYRVIEQSNTIVIMLFWNNHRNPKKLKL